MPSAKSRKAEAPPVQDFLSEVSDSELDLLVSIKELVVIKAKNAGNEELAEFFNANMIQGLGVIISEYMKGRIKNEVFSHSSSHVRPAAEFLKSKRESMFKAGASTADMKPSNLVTPKRKRTKRTCEGDFSSFKKRVA